MTPADVRVLVADDHGIVREGLRSLLESIGGFVVIGEASTGRQAVAMACATLPDLVVMDLSMPDLNGIEATRQIVGQLPDVAVLVLTMFDDDESLFSALQAGARGYILKGSPSDDVERALVSCARGDAVFGPSIARRVQQHFAAGRPDRAPAFPELTDRERTVLDLIARGTSNAQIAARLDISPKTVRNHASNIFVKLHVSSRGEAIIRARDEGLGRR